MSFQKHIQRDVIMDDGAGGGWSTSHRFGIETYLREEGFLYKKTKKRIFGIEWSWLKDVTSTKILIKDNMEIRWFQGDYGNRNHEVWIDNKRVYRERSLPIDEMRKLLRSEKIKEIMKRNK